MITIKADRTALIPEYDMQIGFENDNLVEERYFEIRNKKIFGLSFRLDIESVPDAVLLEKYAESGDSLLLRWVITSQMIGSGGTVRAQIRAFDPEGDEVWHSAIMEFLAKSSLNVTQELSDDETVSEFEQVESRVQSALDTIDDTVSGFTSALNEATTVCEEASGLCSDAATNAESAALSAAEALSCAQNAQSYSDRAESACGRVAEKEAAINLVASEVESTAASLRPHVSSRSNPHEVTAAQVGSYSVAETDALLASKASAAHTHLTALPGGEVDLTQYGLETTSAQGYSYRVMTNFDDTQKVTYLMRSGDEVSASIKLVDQCTLSINGRTYSSSVGFEPYEFTWEGTLSEPIGICVPYGAVYMTVTKTGGRDGFLSMEDKAKIDGFDEKIGDIDAALTSILAVQNGIIGGASA